MYHWMDYLIQTRNVHILHGRNHTAEVCAGPYLLDEYDPTTKRRMNSMDAISTDVQIVKTMRLM